MTDLLVILAVLCVFILIVFALWAGFCIMLKGMFKIADRIFGL